MATVGMQTRNIERKKRSIAAYNYNSALKVVSTGGNDPPTSAL